MTNKKLALYSFLNAIGTVVYISLVAIIMSNGNRLFGQRDTWLTPVAVLLLFVVSASVTGSLVLGRPIMLYMDGQKKDAVTMFFYTVAWLALFMLTAFALMATVFKTNLYY